MIDSLSLNAEHAPEWRWTQPNEDGKGFAALIGPIQYRRVGKGKAQARFLANPDKHSNPLGGVHGAFQAAFAELCLGLPLVVENTLPAGGCVTVDLSLQYYANSAPGEPLIADVELVKETGRMAFVRGTLSQGGTLMTGFNAIMRKLSAPVSQTSA